MKQKMLVIGIMMNNAGTEKSFLSFAQNLDYEKYEVDLLLAKKEGLFLPLVPKKINIIEMEKYGELFLMSGKNSISLVKKLFSKDAPLIFFKLLPYFLKIKLFPSKRASYATKMWIYLSSYLPSPDKEYDIALAYWGDRTMFYMCDKIKAEKKIAWLHFDYRFPPRDDGIYLPYFKKCGAVVNVSETVNDAMKEKLPEIASKCVCIENINDPRLIRNLALRGESFPDTHFDGLRLLSVIRICEQKGCDFIVPILKILKEKKLNLRWYIVGDGEEELVNQLKEQALSGNVADMLILLGPTTNPYTYMRDCDIYVQPSRYEGKPITVEEAKILYKPIVATRYLSAEEQLANGYLGVLTDIDSLSIAKGIESLAADEYMRNLFADRLCEAKQGNTDEINKFYSILDNIK